jgi:flagellar biosynthetic protein FliR
VDLFSAVFLIGFKIAAPITVAILITDLALGIISRAMPQMNVFMLGMPVKIILGFVIMLITIGAFKGIVYVIMDGTYREIYDFLRNAGRP